MSYVPSRNQNSNDTLSWYVIYTHPKQENRAETNLRAWNVETFLPRCWKKRYDQFNGKPNDIIQVLFPRYLFARFSPQRTLSKIRYTRGIHSVVSFGNTITPIDDSVIDFVKSLSGQDGIVQIGQHFHRGDDVRINDGTLKDLIGVFEREMNEADRVMILLKTISLQAWAVVSRHSLEKIPLAPPK